jgi:hypothetical protein
MSAAQLERTLPTTWYRSADIFKVEKERIFCREWIAGSEPTSPRTPAERTLQLIY